MRKFVTFLKKKNQKIYLKIKNIVKLEVIAIVQGNLGVRTYDM